jgi:hypothetical protein
VGEGREKGGWSLQTDIPELQPSQNWRFVIEDHRGEHILEIVFRHLKYERLENQGMDRGIEDLMHVGSQLPLLGAETDFVATVGEGNGQLSQRAGEVFTDGERGTL